MILGTIGLASVILGFAVAIYVVFERFGSKVTAPSVFVTAVMGIVFSLFTGLVMVLVIWPPVTIVSWLIFATFAALVSLLVLTGNKSKKESDYNDGTVNNRADFRSNTGS